MSRRRKSKIGGSITVTFTPEWEKVFRLVPADFARPNNLRLFQGKRHITAVARFRTPLGFVSTAVLRIERDAVGDLVVAGEQLRQSFRLGNPAANPETANVE